MSDDNVVMDRKTIKALGVSTRLEILRLLLDKDMTLSDLADSLDLKAPTVKEHLSELVEAGLIKKEDTDRKWKYYKITFKGKRIVSPYETKVVFSLFSSLLVGAFAVFKIFTTTLQKGASLAMDTMAKSAPVLGEQAASIAGGEPMMARTAMDSAVPEAFNALNTTTTTVRHAVSIMPEIDYIFWIFLSILCVAVFVLSIVAIANNGKRKK